MEKRTITWYIKNWADSGKLKGFSSYQTFGFGGQVIAPKCPTFHIPEPLCRMGKKEISEKVKSPNETLIFSVSNAMSKYDNFFWF